MDGWMEEGRDGWIEGRRAEHEPMHLLLTSGRPGGTAERMLFARAHKAWRQVCVVAERQARSFRRILAARALRRKRRALCRLQMHARDERVHRLARRGVQQQHLLDSMVTSLARRMMRCWGVAVQDAAEMRRKEARAAMRVARLGRMALVLALHVWRREADLIAGAR